EFPECKDLEIIYLAEGMHTSPGTRKSIIRAMTADCYELKNGRLEKSKTPLIKTVSIKNQKLTLISFPAGEALMLPKHSDIQNIRCYLGARVPSFLLSPMPLMQALLKATADILVKHAISDTTPSISQRQNTLASIIVRGSTKGELTVSSKDPYLFTAYIVAKAAVHILKSGTMHNGAIAPSMIAGAGFMKDLFIHYGMSWAMEPISSRDLSRDNS
ncbi:MAG: hypothetical protein K2X27_04580, partial [Candidatus Obscuribacterales bacterium]|nr:hypothetical protein [Candidatus Obscuribacterales bacterium]